MMSLEDIGKLNIKLSKIKEGQVVDVPNLTDEDVNRLKLSYNAEKYIIKGPIKDVNGYTLAFELNPNYGGQKNA